MVVPTDFPKFWGSETSGRLKASARSPSDPFRWRQRTPRALYRPHCTGVSPHSFPSPV